MKVLHAHRLVLGRADVLVQLLLPGHVPLGKIRVLIRIPQHFKPGKGRFLLGRDDRNLFNKEIGGVVKPRAYHPKGGEVGLQGGHGAVVDDAALGEEEEVGEQVEGLGGRLVDDAHDDLPVIGEFTHGRADAAGHEGVEAWIEGGEGGRKLRRDEWAR